MLEVQYAHFLHGQKADDEAAEEAKKIAAAKKTDAAALAAFQAARDQEDASMEEAGMLKFWNQEKKETMASNTGHLHQHPHAR